MALGFIIGIIVAVAGIIGLVYAFTIQQPHLEELKKEQGITKQDLISSTKELEKSRQNMLSSVREKCNTAPSPDVEIKCIHVFKTIKAQCDSPPVRYPEEEQYRSSCKDAEQYLSLHKNDLAGDIGDITNLEARRQLIQEMVELQS